MNNSKEIFYYLFTAFLFMILFSSCDKDSSDENNPTFAILFPNGDDLLEKGKSYVIEWSGESNDNIKIELYNSDTIIYTIVNSTENDGQFNWQVPDNIDVGIHYNIQIFGNDNHTDISDNRFIIIDPIERSVLIDTRDGQEYKTVKIGDQWWMAENFNYNAPTGSSSYFFDSSYSDTYGKLYTWQSAYDNAPTGWHLPTDDEWKELEGYLGILNDKLDQEGWRGEFTGELLKDGNASGFDVIWSGYFNASVSKFGHLGYEARFWSVTIASGDMRYWARLFQVNKSGITRNNTHLDFGLSVRYVKNE